MASSVNVLTLNWLTSDFWEAQMQKYHSIECGVVSTTVTTLIALWASALFYKPTFGFMSRLVMPYHTTHPKKAH